MATFAPWVKAWSGLQPVGPTHDYLASSQMMITSQQQPSSYGCPQMMMTSQQQPSSYGCPQMMMTSQQQPSYYGCPPAIFIRPGQYRAQYNPPTQQYPVTSGTLGFSLGSSPAVHPAYEQQKLIRYDRKFLLSLQFHSASMNKPAGLPNIRDVILVKPPWPRRFQQSQRRAPRKIISITSFSNDVQLNKAEKAWKSAVKTTVGGRGTKEVEKSQELLGRLRSILNKLTPEKFQELMKQVMALKIDTEERLKGAVDLIFEKALSEPNFSVTYASMCRCLVGLKVPTSNKPGDFVNFHKLLLRRCQKEFEKDQDGDAVFEKQQREMEAAKEGEERERLRVELQKSRDKARCRSLGNVKLIGELFKQKVLSEAIMHDCVVKLLKSRHEESLECLCRLLSTVGKDLDSEKTEPRMDQYFNRMDKIIKERKTSSRICFMLQDVFDLRKSNWVPRRGDQGPKTIHQIHEEAEMEEHREQIKVQKLLSQKEGGGGNIGGRGRGGRTSHPQDERWNMEPISKNRPINNTHLSKITKPGSLDSNSLVVAPGRTLNHFSALQQSGFLLTSPDSDHRAPQRSISSCEHGGGGQRGDHKGHDVHPKPSLSKEKLEKKSTAIIEEYLHINDLKEALQCVAELNSTSLLYLFVRKGVESTLERKAKAREQMGLLLHHLVKEGVLPTEQYYKGLEETLEAAEDLSIDVPHIWLYLAELIAPMLHEGGIPMGQLFREISKPLVPLGLAGLLLLQIFQLLCKEMTPKKVRAMWTEGRLNWIDFLSEDEDVYKSDTEQKVEFTTGEEMDSKEVEKKKVLIGEELSNQLDGLIEDKTNSQHIRD